MLESARPPAAGGLSFSAAGGRDKTCAAPIRQARFIFGELGERLAYKSYFSANRIPKKEQTLRLLLKSHILFKMHRYRRALIGLAFEVDRRAHVLRRVLDYGKAEARSARLL